MRFVLTSLLLPLSLALAGCGLASFDIPITDTVTIEAGAPTDASETLELPERFKQLRIEKTKEFADSGFGIKDVESVKLSRAKIRVLTEGANLDFLKSATFYVEGPAGSGIEKQVVGSVSNIPEGQTSIDVKVGNANLKDFAMLDSMTVSATAERGELEEPIELEIHAVFHVEIL